MSTTGELMAQVDIDDPTGVTPAAVGDMIYFATQGARVLCVNWREAKGSVGLRARQKEVAVSILARGIAGHGGDRRARPHDSWAEGRHGGRAVDFSHPAELSTAPPSSLKIAFT